MAMHLKSVLVPVISHVKKIWPRRIISKIAIINVLVLVATVCGLSWYALIEKSATRISSNVAQYKEYAGQLARVSEHYIKSGHTGELEELISSFMMMEGVYDVCIKDVAFNTLIALRNHPDGRVTSFKEKHKRIAPIESGQHVRIGDTSLELWQQIEADNPVGWIYINRQMQPIDNLTVDFAKTSITALILAIAVCLIALQRILREPMQSLRRAAEFSEWLDMAQGNHLPIQTSSREVEHLILTLNKTSEKMYQNGLKEKREHMLVDTIRDIQTRYIENSDTRQLNDRVLQRVVSLTGSEYGFLGEVRLSKLGKPFIKIMNFSKLSRNVTMQAFMEEYAPPDMEFHNAHNLFGAVLQTRKPTIANDPARDPRSGGLPPGHPPLHSFLALPIFHDDDIVAVIGLANRPGGYDQLLVSFLDPLMTTIGHIVVASRHNNRRALAKRQLEQKEALLRRILATVSDGIVTLNSAGFIETVNPATERMFGYLGEEILNQHINQLLPGLYDEEFRAKYVSEGATRYHNASACSKDGRNFAVELTVGEFTLLDEKMYTVTIIDLPHLQASGSVLGHIDESYVELQRMVHAGAWQYDVATRRIKASQQVYHIFAMEPQAGWISLQNFTDRVSEEDRHLIVLALDRCHTNNEPFVIELRILDLHNKPRFVQMQGDIQAAGKTGGGKVSGVIQDVTETWQKIKLKDEFITSVSEEIRSPLTSIRGSIGILSGEVAKYINEKEKFLLDTAYQHTDRLLLLINDILDIEHIATGKTVFNMEFLECRKLLDTVVMANREVEKNYGVNFHFDMKSRDIVLIADRQRLVQMFSILMSNAAKHSPMGADIHISAEVIEGSLVIMVRDNGEGIPADVQPKLFDLYARARYLKSDHPESTGLGLCVARSIVERHKGTIDLHSEEGKGTTIYVRLPVPQQNVAVLNL